eukprot:NODE_107_length_2523_cov_69.948666_g74_i0.p1 GENE.NODE_107_length_2523_cov_69.948666_g74_i0~~NODE_107_length_2523_cov_69.948666_g74_i0.p1  ORF type:complete len:733 (+),score=198.69 NODE_107_length_2523_cov_69.948666_g74_i0:29-2227(+)
MGKGVEARLSTLDPTADDYVDSLHSAVTAAAATGKLDILTLLHKKNAFAGEWSDWFCKPLYRAAQYNQAAAIELLLEFGEDIEGEGEGYYKPVYIAADCDSAAALAVLVEKGADVTTVSNGHLPLHACAQRGAIPSLELLLAHNASATASDPEDGITATMLASHCGHAETVRLLLEHGADARAVAGDGVTALMVGCIHPAVREVLLKAGAGADINAADCDGFTALHYAARCGTAADVEALLAAGADSGTVQADGTTALMHAALSGKAETVALLVLRGADVNAVNEEGLSAIMLAAQLGLVPVVTTLVGHGADLKACCANGRTLMMVVAAESSEKQMETLEALLDLGVPATGVDNEGNTTAIHYINSQFCGAQDPDVSSAPLRGLELLIKHGADPIAPSTTDHPMIRAIYTGSVAILGCLLAHKADVNVVHEGQTPLQAALDATFMCCTHSLVMFLAANGAAVNVADAEGMSPFLMACASGEVKTLEVLLAHGADLNAVSRDGKNAMGHCVCGSDTTMIEAKVDLLLSKGLAIDQADPDGRTPLMLAAETGSLAVELLLKKSANLNAADREGHTALMWAAKGSSTEVLQALVQAGGDVNGTNTLGETVLMMLPPSWVESYMEPANVLLGHGARINAVNKQGRTVIHYLAADGWVRISKALVALGADPDVADKEGVTPMMLAVSADEEDMVEALIELGVTSGAPPGRQRAAMKWMLGLGMACIVVAVLARTLKK